MSISFPQLVSLVNICTLLHLPDVCLVTVTTFPQFVRERRKEHEKQLLSGQQCNTKKQCRKVVTSMKMAKHLQ